MSATVEPVRWGIAGPGWIARQMVAALGELPDAHVVAVGSRAPERARAFAERHDISRAHGSYEALFADDEVDLVYVAGPHSVHRDHTVGALEAGRHVLCEKAFALDAAEAREMADTAHRTERFLMEAMWTWFLPSIADVRRRIDAGAIGRVRALQADFALSMPGTTGRHRELALGGGALLDLGVYPVALGHLLLGPPRGVVARGDLGPTGVDQNLGAVMEHDDGALTVLYTGLDASSTMGATIVGTEGRIRLDPQFWCTTSFTVEHDDAPPERVEVPHLGLAHEAMHAMDRIRGGHLESDVMPLAASIAVMETLDAIRAQIGLRYPGRPSADRRSTGAG